MLSFKNVRRTTWIARSSFRPKPHLKHSARQPCLKPSPPVCPCQNRVIWGKVPNSRRGDTSARFGSVHRGWGPWWWRWWYSCGQRWSSPSTVHEAVVQVEVGSGCPPPLTFPSMAPPTPPSPHTGVGRSVVNRGMAASAQPTCHHDMFHLVTVGEVACHICHHHISHFDQPQVVTTTGVNHGTIADPGASRRRVARFADVFRHVGEGWEEADAVLFCTHCGMQTYQVVVPEPPG